jgi:two-component system, response regulator RegA
MISGQILLVDDDPAFREPLARELRLYGYDVLTAPAAARTARLARSHAFRYAAVDVQAPHGRGLALVSELRRLLIDVRIVALVRQGKIETALDAMGRGAHFYLSKPVTAAALSRALTGRRPRRAARSAALTLRRVEWNHMQRVLAGCGGNVSETARRLGVTRRTVQLKLKQGPPP